MQVAQNLVVVRQVLQDVKEAYEVKHSTEGQLACIGSDELTGRTATGMLQLLRKQIRSHYHVTRASLFENPQDIAGPAAHFQDPVA